MQPRRHPPNPTGEMPFLDHLEELRWRILWMLVAIGIGAAIGLVVSHYFGALEILLVPVQPYLSGEKLAYFSPATPFFVTLKLGLLIGILLAFPVVVYQAWAFFSPALEPSERRVIVPSLYFGLVLFCAGVLMAYFWVLPLALRFLTGFQSEFLVATIGVDEYLAFVLRLLFAFGVVFELPVVVMILSAMGLVTPEFMKEKRRHAIVAITILASALTPGDIASTFLMIGPMIILYEGSIVLSHLIHRRKADQGELHTPSPEPPSGSVGVEG